MIFLEPQCIGFEHAQVNANFLFIYSQTFPEDSLEIFGESEHLELVHNALKGMRAQVQLKANEINLIGFGRLGKLKKDCRNILLALQTCAKSNNTLCMLSATPLQLLALKIINILHGIRVYVVMHGMLNAMNSPPSGFFRRLFWVKNIIGSFNSPNITYLLNSKYIEANLIKSVPRIQKYVKTLELPWFFEEVKKNPTNLSRHPIVASAGTASLAKGSNSFFMLAKDFSENYSDLNCKFEFVGHIIDSKLRSEVNSFVSMPPQNKPIESSEYQRLLGRVNFLAFFYPTDSYHFGVSGVFFDAVNAEVPIIALRNPCFEYFFRKYGCLGWLCESYEDIKSTLISEIMDPDINRFFEIKRNFSKMKSDYSVDNQTKRMKLVFEGC